MLRSAVAVALLSLFPLGAHAGAVTITLAPANGTTVMASVNVSDADLTRIVAYLRAKRGGVPVWAGGRPSVNVTTLSDSQILSRWLQDHVGQLAARVAAHEKATSSPPPAGSPGAAITITSTGK